MINYADHEKSSTFNMCCFYKYYDHGYVIIFVEAIGILSIYYGRAHS